MEIKLLCGSRNFLIDKSVKNFQIDDFVISTDRDILFKLFGETEFISKAGLNSIPILEKYPYFVSIGEADHYLSNTDILTEDRLSEKKLELLQFFIFCLWFIRDNSANSDHLYTYVLEKKLVFSRTRTIVFSNSNGEYVDTQFSINDINTAKDICYRLFELRTTEIKKEKEDEVKDYNKIKTGDFNYILYSSQNRIDRAILFLTLARSNSYLPLKISFYIAIYEALFTTENTEVSHKVTERATFFLGGDFETKLKNFKIIKTAYNIRSKFVHGQQLDKKKIKTKEDLICLSNQIDTLTRDLLNKIIKTDSNIFLLDDEKLNEWFNQLILK